MLDMKGYSFPFVLSGQINFKPVAVPMVSRFEAEQYINQLQWWMKREGGNFNLALWSKDNTKQVFQVKEKYAGDRNAKTIGELSK